LLAIQQFVIAAPDIRSIEFGASDPYDAVFEVHNSMWFDMHDVQVAVLPGMMHIRAGPSLRPKKDLNEKMVPFGATACEELSNFRDPSIGAERNLMMRVNKFEVIRSGDSVKLALRDFAVGDVRVILGLRVLYRPKVWGRFPLWWRTVCREFETARDSDGRTHLVPN
jgi:hypothetical protein